MGSLRIMSHNVWKCDSNCSEWEAKGEDCSAPTRAKGMVRVYTETQPDIIGFQEMSFMMADEIILGLAKQGQRYAPYSKPVIQNALSRGYVHAHDIATEFADQDWGYHYCFADGYKAYVEAPFEKALDHILVKFAPNDFVRRFKRYTPDYYLPQSEHSPVFADVML